MQAIIKYRKLNQDDTNELVYYDKEGVKWVAVDDWIKFYKLRPHVILAMILGQMVSYYRYVDKFSSQIGLKTCYFLITGTLPSDLHYRKRERERINMTLKTFSICLIA